MPTHSETWRRSAEDPTDRLGEPLRGHRLVVIIAAHNEEASIAATLESVLAQDRRPDSVVVAADNCSDRTYQIVRSVRGVRFFRTRANQDKKPGALNQAWRRYCRTADLVVCVDADTILPPDALRGWEEEFRADPSLGGCSAKFTMVTTPDMSFTEQMLVTLQRAEFSKWTDLALRRKRQTNVLAGTACCFRNDALRQVAARRSHGGEEETPWTVASLVEDFELTFRLRQLGWATKVSASVRAYTDAMTDLRSLWAQRMKWQTGTVHELLRFGINRLTLFDWWQQCQGLIAIVVRLMWLVLTIAAVTTGTFHWHPIWFIPPVLFLANDVKQAFRIPMRTKRDVLVAALLAPQETFAWMRAAWFAASWIEALSQRLFGVPRRDRWKMQASAERNRRTPTAQPA